MEIKDVEINSIAWSSYSFGPYADVSEKIKAMKMNTAIEVVLDKSAPGFQSAIQGRVKRMDPDFKIKVKMLDRKDGESKMGKRWAIAKLPQDK